MSTPTLPIPRLFARAASAATALVITAALPGCGDGSQGQSDPESSAGEAGLDLPELETAAAVLAAFADYRARDEDSRAEAVIAAAVRRWPDDPTLRTAFGELLLTTERYDDARRQFDEAIALGQTDGPTLFASGMAASMAGDHTAAESSFDGAAKAAPGRVDYAIHLGQARLRLNDLPGANAALVRAAAIDESRAIIWGTLGEIALRENRPRLAAQHAAKARSLEPAVTPWRLIEARGLKRMGEPEEAILVLRGVVEGDLASPPVARTLAECFGLLGRPADGLDAIEHAARMGGDDASLWFDAAVWAQRADRTDTARRHAARAAELGHDAAAELLTDLTEDAVGS